MPRRTRLTFEGEHFLISEEPHGLHHPALTVFTHLENRRFPAREGGPCYRTEEDRWSPFATWVDGHVVPLAPYEHLNLDIARSLFQRYLRVRDEGLQRETAKYYFLSRDDRPVHVLLPAQPSGLVVPLFRAEAGAEAARRQLESPATIESTGSLRRFLETRAEEGYAGAVLDSLVPVFWCLDESGQMQFLALHAREGEQEVRSALLAGDNEWRSWDGEQALAFFEDQDNWDRLMRRTLGDVPFFGYRPGIVLLALYQGEEPLIVPPEDADDDGACLPLFFEREACEEFRRQNAFVHHEARTVGNLVELVRRAAAQGAVAQLQPGEHRARSASLWCDNDHVVLDGFSGFWRSDDGHTFRRIP